MIFWGNCSNSGKICTKQKKSIRVMAGTQPRTSCSSLFKQVEILHVPCQYILSLINFIINNQENFPTDSSVHNINTRNKQYLLRPNVNLSCQKSTFYADITIFNSLPPNVTMLKNDKAKFKAALRKYVHTHFFTLQINFFMCKDDLSNCFCKILVVFYKFVYLYL